MEAVLSHLAAIAKERREQKPLPLHEVSRKTVVGDDAVRKFERGQQGKNIDRMANAYADALEIPVFELWDEAIKRAKKAAPADALPTPPSGDPDARTAKQEAQRKADELEKELGGASRPSRTSERRNAGSKRGSRKK